MMQSRYLLNRLRASARGMWNDDASPQGLPDLSQGLWRLKIKSAILR